MDSRKLVFVQTGTVLIGQIVCVGIMFVVYALLGAFAGKVALGGAVGGVIALLNFFFMALAASLAADKAEREDVTGAKKLVQLSYPVRMLVLAVVLFACAKSGFFDLIALVLPLLFVRPTLMVAEFFRKRGA